MMEPDSNSKTDLQMDEESEKRTSFLPPHQRKSDDQHQNQTTGFFYKRGNKDIRTMELDEEGKNRTIGFFYNSDSPIKTLRIMDELCAHSRFSTSQATQAHNQTRMATNSGNNRRNHRELYATEKRRRCREEEERKETREAAP
ncbi:hypothetical protein M9H77_04445 [Catharanthus roseus]|uniref:Uncharacterized protein n=1 Tax=Catharanthus roseus TaxID=4058 RepID=A0ACC0CEE5_CATRO|nr:hypothetical protein M9H77_04445 [Catharanthus roseus]